MLGEPSQLMVPVCEPAPDPAVMEKRLAERGYRLEAEHTASMEPTPSWLRTWRSPDGARVHTVWPLRARRPVLLEPCDDDRCRYRDGGVAGPSGPALFVVTFLGSKRPLGDWTQQFRFVVDLMGGANAVFDHCTFRTIAAEQVERYALERRPPALEEVMVLHQVFGEQPSDEIWLHTHGLQRFGVPDLELLRLPPAMVPEGARLLHAVARHALTSKMPPPRRPFEITRKARLSWIPLADALPCLLEGERGSAAERTEPPTDVRAVLLAPWAGGDGRKKDGLAVRLFPPLEALAAWSPRDVREGIEHHLGRARKARRTWSTLARAFAEHGHDARWIFLLWFAYPALCGHPGQEPHVVETVDLESRRVLARRYPREEQADERQVRLGPARWHALDRLVDWLIFGPEGDLAPEDVASGPSPWSRRRA